MFCTVSKFTKEIIKQT